MAKSKFLGVRQLLTISRLIILIRISNRVDFYFVGAVIHSMIYKTKMVMLKLEQFDHNIDLK